MHVNMQSPCKRPPSPLQSAHSYPLTLLEHLSSSLPFDVELTVHDNSLFTQATKRSQYDQLISNIGECFDADAGV